MEFLEALGCDPGAGKERVRIITGSGYVLAPQVVVSQIQALDERRSDFRVLAHTLPGAGPVDGLLGMDFLVAVKAKLDLADGVVEIP